MNAPFGLEPILFCYFPLQTSQKFTWLIGLCADLALRFFNISPRSPFFEGFVGGFVFSLFLYQGMSFSHQV